MTGLQRINDECALTTIYLTNFACWLFDDSVNNRKSKDALNTVLRQWLRFSCNSSKPSLEPTDKEEAQQQSGH